MPELFVITLEPVLNSASAGLELATRILESARDGSTVALDFIQVERMTPSYANALVMTLLHAHSLQWLRENVILVHRDERITRAMNDSVKRYENGIRLNNQRDAVQA